MLGSFDRTSTFWRLRATSVVGYYLLVQSSASRSDALISRLAQGIAADARLVGIKLIDHMMHLCSVWGTKSYGSAAEY